MPNYDDDTTECERKKTFAEQFFVGDEVPMKLQFGAVTHVGNVRSRNEDHHAVIRNTRRCEVLFTNLPDDDRACPEDEAYGMVVADGIGGGASGDVASRMAIRTMLDLTGRASSWVMKITDQVAHDIHRRVEAYISEIQNTLRDSSADDPALTGMGTTWTSAHLFAAHCMVVHIGDSRAYLYRDGELQLITRDQTLGQEMADAGLPEEEVRRFRNILVNSLGGSSQKVQAEIYHAELQPGDRLLLCTDGLSDMISDTEIASVLDRLPETQSACDRLIQEALAAGGKDNITVALCDLAESLPHRDEA